MKKYFLGLIALVVGLGLSAFTLPVKKEVKSTGTALVWYFVDGSDEIDPGDPINEGSAMDQAAFHTAFPQYCEEGSNVACVRGYLPTALPDESTDSGEEDILKN